MKQTIITVSLAAVLLAVPAAAQQDGIPPLDHAFVVVLENHAYSGVIGNPNAPVINALAAQYNSATNYSAVGDPSLPNYLAMVAGDSFGVSNDLATTISVPPGPYTFNAPTIGTQLEAIGKDWRSYQEDIPAIGSLTASWPGDANFGILYSVKHNPFFYFQAHQTQSELDKAVPLTELFSDLTLSRVPAFSLIVPNECNDMHGQDKPPLSPCTGYSDAAIVARGDFETGMLVSAIMGSDIWNEGKNALFIIFDGGEHHEAGVPVPSIVITNYGVEGVQDATSYNHYSLLKTLEAGFKLPYLGHAADAGTMTMAPMMQPKPDKD